MHSAFSIPRPSQLPLSRSAALLAIVAFAGAAVAGTLLLPLWGWLLVATVLATALAAAVAPVALWALMVGLVIVLPNTAYVAEFVVCGAVALLAFTAPPAVRTPRLLIVPLLLYAGYALLTTRGELAPWETIRQFYVPGTPLLVAPFPSYESLAMLQFLMLPALALTTPRIVTSPERLTLLSWVVVAASIPPVARGLLDAVLGNVSARQGFSAVQSMYVHPNQFAAYLAVLIPLLAAIAVQQRGLALRCSAAGMAALALGCLGLTYTRSAWLGLALAALAAGVLGGYWRQTVAITIVALAIGLSTGVGGAVAGRFADLSEQSSTSTDSLSWRLRTWSRVLGDTPAWQITGSGFETYSRRTVEVFGFNDPRVDVRLQAGWRQGFGAHNDVLRQYVELGMLGLGLWLAFIGGLLTTALRAWHRIRSPWSIAALIGTVATVLASLSDNIESYGGYTLPVIAVLAGASSVAARHAPESEGGA
jgi:O-antigen ligase